MKPSPYPTPSLSRTLPWQSQNRNSQKSELGQKIYHHRERQIPVYLFVRRRDKIGGQTQPFL